MQINLPTDNPSHLPDAGARTAHLEKAGAAESFDHYLGAGETSSSNSPAAKTSQGPRQTSAQAEPKTAKAQPQDDLAQVGSLAALSQAFATPPPPVPLPTGGVADLGTTDTSPDLPSAEPVASLFPSVGASVNLQPTPQSTLPSRPLAKGPLDLPLPSADPFATTAGTEPSLFPADAPANPLKVADAAALQSVEQAIVANTATTNAPLPTPAALASTTPIAEASVPSPEEKDATLEQSAELPVLQLSSSPSVQLPPRGTAAAMERSTMSDALLHRQAKAKAAGFTASEKIPFAASTSKPVAPVVAATSTSRTPEEPATPADQLSSESLGAVASATNSALQNHTVSESGAPTKAMPMTAEATAALEKVQQMTEHLHTTGQRSVELEVQLEGEQRLTISLHMERGELRTTFKTDSADLQNALTQNWGQVAEKSDRSLRFNPPIFESPSAQSGFMNDPRQQGRQERAFSEAGEGQRFTFSTPAPAKTAPVTRPTSLDTVSGLELYA